MNQIVSFVLGRVIRIRIDGQITKSLANQIADGLHKSRFYKPEGIVVTINSSGGSISQAKTISDMLKKFSNQKNIPIYCFAEDVCLSSAHLILTSGAKCYANSMTLLGDYGYCWSALWFDKIRQKYQMKSDNLKANQNSLSMHVFQQVSAESQQWMKKYLKSLEQDLKHSIYENRSKNRNQLKVNQEQFSEKLKDRGCLSTQQAVQIGLIDGIRDCDEILHDTFKGVKVYQIGKKPFQKYRSAQTCLRQVKQQLKNPYKGIF